MNIAYQGVPGSFSYITAQEQFGKDHNFIGTKEFREIFEHLQAGRAERAVIPVENTVAGSIYENYDYLSRYNAHVIGERTLKVEHYLLGIKTNDDKESRLKKITKVYSHIKALEQCESFLQNHHWMEKIVYSDTAGAAQMVSEKKDPANAAIASNLAAEIYHLDILAANIEDNHENFTRFLVISSTPSETVGGNKCSLILTLPHIPGSLYEALGIFAKHSMNLTKLESRPIIGKPFEYNFYIDIEFQAADYERIKEVINTEFKQKTQTLKILGFYQSLHP